MILDAGHLLPVDPFLLVTIEHAFIFRLTVESFEYYTMLEEDKRRYSWGKIVILMLKKMMLLDDERVSNTILCNIIFSFLACFLS